MEFKPAQRKRAKLRLGIVGPSGSGKSYLSGNTGYSKKTSSYHVGQGKRRGRGMKGLDLRQDLINYIGCRILVAHRDITPKLLDDVCSNDEEACAEQEAIYLISLVDGLALAELLPTGKSGSDDV